MSVDGKRLPSSFTLPDQHGKQFLFGEQVGRYILVMWYPTTKRLNNGRSCRRQMVESIRMSQDEVAEAGLSVVGISYDTVEENLDFCRYAFQLFPLLSDTTHHVAEWFGVTREGEWYEYPRKRSFLLGPDLTVLRTYTSVDPDFHIREVLADLATLRPVSTDSEPFKIADCVQRTTLLQQLRSTPAWRLGSSCAYRLMQSALHRLPGRTQQR